MSLPFLFVLIVSFSLLAHILVASCIILSGERNVIRFVCVFVSFLAVIAIGSGVYITGLSEINT